MVEKDGELTPSQSPKTDESSTHSGHSGKAVSNEEL